MTMKKCFIVALCVAGMMSSCSDIDDNIANDAKSSILLTQQEYASIVPDSQLEMTQDEIVDMVSKFSTTGNSTRAIAANPTIVKKFSLSSYSNGKQIPLYEVSLNEGDDAGYAIVSGDERVPGVIAYVEHGSLNDTLTNKGAAMMLKEAQRSLISKVKAVDVVIDSLRASAKAKISAKIGTSSFTFEGGKRPYRSSKGYYSIGCYVQSSGHIVKASDTTYHHKVESVCAIQQSYGRDNSIRNAKLAILWEKRCRMYRCCYCSDSCILRMFIYCQWCFA